MEFILSIILIICVRGFMINDIKKSKIINSLSTEERELLNSSKEKVKKQRKIMNIFKIVGILFLIIFISYLIIGILHAKWMMKHQPVHKIGDISFVTYSVDYNKMWCLIFCSFVIYAIVRIPTYLIFLHKISKNETLLDREKELLKLYYSNKILPIISIILLTLIFVFATEIPGCF